MLTNQSIRYIIRYPEKYRGTKVVAREMKVPQGMSGDCGRSVARPAAHIRGQDPK